MKKWKILAEDNGDLFPVYFLYECLNEQMESILGVKCNNWMHHGKNQCWEFIMDPDNWEELASAAYKKLKNEKEFLKAVREKILVGCEKMIEVSEKIHKTDLSKLSKKKLWALFQEYRQKNKDMYVWGVIPVLIDFEITRLSDEVKEIIREKLQKEFKEQFLTDYFITLTTPKEDSFLKLEERSFLNIAKDIIKNPEAGELFKKDIAEIKDKLADFKDIDKKIDEHTENFKWTGYGYLGPVWTKDYYLELFSSFVKQGDDPEKKLREIEEKDATIEKEKKEILNELDFSEDELHLTDSLKEFAFLKLYRKDMQYKSYYHMHNWLEEVSSRFNLTIRQLRHMVPEEIEAMLLNDKLPDKNILDERVKFYTFVLQNQKLFILHGKEAREFYEKTAEKKEAVDIDELKGDCACQGKAVGVIKLIRTFEDMKKMNKGDILISPATNPNLVPAMKKAGAIVTDEGGITCHAAIVSRELGVPCITGTKLVTRAFKDGDKVDVDATKGIIRRVK